jgi:hypothetical protein
VLWTVFFPNITLLLLWFALQKKLSRNPPRSSPVKFCPREKAKIIEEGEKWGIEKRLEKGKSDIAQQILARGMEADTVLQLTGLALKSVNSLKK